MNSDKNTQRTFLKDSASLQKLKNKVVSQTRHTLFEVDKRKWRLKSFTYFSLQSN